MLRQEILCGGGNRSHSQRKVPLADSEDSGNNRLVGVQLEQTHTLDSVMHAQRQTCGRPWFKLLANFTRHTCVSQHRQRIDSVQTSRNRRIV